MKSEYENVLNKPFWPKELHPMTSYSRLQDDCGGDCLNPEQKLSVMFGQDGDAWVSIGENGGLRYRTLYGGGRSLRTRQALVILAEAIRLDELEKPDPK